MRYEKKEDEDQLKEIAAKIKNVNEILESFDQYPCLVSIKFQHNSIDKSSCIWSYFFRELKSVEQLKPIFQQELKSLQQSYDYIVSTAKIFVSEQELINFYADSHKIDQSLLLVHPDTLTWKRSDLKERPSKNNNPEKENTPLGWQEPGSAWKEKWKQGDQPATPEQIQRPHHQGDVIPAKLDRNPMFPDQI